MEIVTWPNLSIYQIPSQDNPFNDESQRDSAIVVCMDHLEPGYTVGEMVVWTYSTVAQRPVIRGQFPHESDAIMFAQALANAGA